MDGEPETLSDTATNCNLASASETLSDNNQVKLDSLEKKAIHLRLVLERDFKAADIKWSLFVAAAFSFRYESCLRPFPPAFIKNGIKDMDELLSIITDVPALDLVLQQLDNLDNLANISEIIDLLFYVLVRLKEPSLKTVPEESHDAVLFNAHSLVTTTKPQYIFQVASTCKSSAEMKWKELSKSQNVFYAYHGNRLENFYTILNFGLQQHLNKTTLLGNGVYLSPDLSLSLPYSHGGFGWGASCIGGHLSCIAMCEVIDAPEGINYQKPVTSGGDGVQDDGKSKKAIEPKSDAQMTHYIVTNCDLVRVRYLLVYAKQPVSMRFITANSNRNAGGLWQWLSRHKLFSILLGYGLMLATIGLANNQPIHYYYKTLIKKLEVAFNTPERHTGWRRTFFAHRMPPRCPQPGYNSSEYSEDCLFLNIWTTRRADGKLQPVLVLLYSESWSNSGISLPCQELASEGVVVVTVSYRLHLLSFFTLKSTAARGNLALFDQYLALVWIRENIAAFGGDPSSVTLAGHSVGANSVLHHILSARPVGLFHRAIVMSPRDAWKILDKHISLNTSEVEKISREIASFLGCSSKSDREILQCMRARPVSDIVNFKLDEMQFDYIRPFPDDFLPESEQYLTSSPSNILGSTSFPNMQLDLLIGSTDLETINYMDDNKYNKLMKQSPKTVYEYATAKIIPELLRTLSLDHSETLTMLTKAVEWEYWNSDLITNSNKESNKAVESVARMESAGKWSAGEAVLAAKMARRISRLYVYRYSEPSVVDLRGGIYNFTGAVHGSDLIALLGDALMLQVARRPASKGEKRISSIFRKYFVNFIKFGSPGNQDEWPRYVLQDPNVHEIFISEGTKCNVRSTSRDLVFWLEYLPQLANLMYTNGQSEHFKTDEGESRLRGGVFAMCGVSVTLLLLLCVSIILLHRGRTYRASISEDGTHL
ncbi:acetylcholinesterase-like [Epargyreus clarus]|uniref:acetylcholinesterase-like n=1 Tax=Epargyreus clarus TaxID=520877 RepID=UPI003C2E9E53